MWSGKLFLTNSARGSSANPKRILGEGDTLGFFSRSAASLESRASPKKADERGGGGGGGGGTPTLFPDSTFFAQFSRHRIGVPIEHHKPSDKQKKKVHNVREHVKRVLISINIIQPQKSGGHLILCPPPSKKWGDMSPCPPPPGFAPMARVGDKSS